METKGLIMGKLGLGLMIFLNIGILSVYVVMVLGCAPLEMWILCGVINLYMLYMAIFAATRYYVDEKGIYTESLLSRYIKRVSWNEVKLIREMVLACTNNVYGGGDNYYIISTQEDVEAERGILENMKCKTMICIPITGETKACMVYYACMHQLNIIAK